MNSKLKNKFSYDLSLFIIKQVQIYFYAHIILWNFYISTFPNAQKSKP